MKPRERLLAVLHGELPDCVPVDPDSQHVLPADRQAVLDIYVYKNPPLWKAHIDALKLFDWMAA